MGCHSQATAVIAALVLGAACGPRQTVGAPEPAVAEHSPEGRRDPVGVTIEDVDVEALPATPNIDIQLPMLTAGGGAPPSIAIPLMDGALPPERRSAEVPMPEIVDWARALGDAHSEVELRVAPQVPFETVSDVAGLLIGTPVRRLWLHVQSQDRAGRLPIDIRPASAPMAGVAMQQLLGALGGALQPTADDSAETPTESPAQPTTITIRVQPDGGHDLWLDDQWLSPGCAGPGERRGRTVAAGDLQRVRSCASVLRARLPEPRPTLVTADPAVPFEQVARTMASVQRWLPVQHLIASRDEAAP